MDYRSDFPQDKTYHGIRTDRPIDKECGNDRCNRGCDFIEGTKETNQELQQDVNNTSQWVQASLRGERDPNSLDDDRSTLEKVGDAIKGAGTSIKETLAKSMGK